MECLNVKKIYTFATRYAADDMNKENYQLTLDGIIRRHEAAGEVPTLLLHSCCAPCSSYTLEYLAEHFRITLLYFNPNISPESEFLKRQEEQQRLIKELPAKHKVSFIAGRYDPKEFFDAVRGLENELEGGARCSVCFRLRLTEAARNAVAIGADYFSTTLTISPLKNAERINTIGQEVAREYGVKFLPADLKKRGGYLRSIELSRKYNLYRQNYCGCVFSRRTEQR